MSSNILKSNRMEEELGKGFFLLLILRGGWMTHFLTVAYTEETGSTHTVHSNTPTPSPHSTSNSWYIHAPSLTYSDPFILIVPVYPSSDKAIPVWLTVNNEQLWNSTLSDYILQNGRPSSFFLIAKAYRRVPQGFQAKLGTLESRTSVTWQAGALTTYPRLSLFCIWYLTRRIILNFLCLILMKNWTCIRIVLYFQKAQTRTKIHCQLILYSAGLRLRNMEIFMEHRIPVSQIESQKKTKQMNYVLSETTLLQSLCTVFISYKRFKYSRYTIFLTENKIFWFNVLQAHILSNGEERDILENVTFVTRSLYKHRGPAL